MLKVFMANVSVSEATLKANLGRHSHDSRSVFDTWQKSKLSDRSSQISYRNV